MKIICPKCGIIHDEDFAPCKSTLSLPSAEDASHHTTADIAAPTLIEDAPQFAGQARAAAAAAGAGRMGPRLAEPERGVTAVVAPQPPEPQRPAAQPEWRREVAQRLETYRARRRKYQPPDAREGRGGSQPFLALGSEHRRAPRDEAALAEETSDDAETQSSRGLPIVRFAAPDLAADPEEYMRRRAALRVAARPRSPDRVEISVAQPQFDFSVSERQNLHPRDEARPVADLRERRLAGLVDAAILGLTCAGFYLLFRALGGEIWPTRFGLASCLALAFLVYAQYFVLFTVFLGVTPGMILRGLEVRALDGRSPTTRHLVWRSFGYLLSCGAVFLGFLWALWDDDGLTWQDRISQTYLTPAEAAPGEELLSRLQES